METVEREIMLIAQEECAEVTQAISKVFRFGFGSCHPVTGKSNIDNLEEEVGDLKAMIELMENYGLINKATVEKRKAEKFTKLKEWSGINTTYVSPLNESE